ncbi:neurobeachin-like isoform X3 [Acanthaster planci]|uniref:Neurobeachin-like isoform X3 n=1 Tax=Acanthaster planci TaxID=133434 RepID=A0A8B7Z6M3_ACAPL|nr:neurobeachin-like isoform X3 [Acanthaster planci]
MAAEGQAGDLPDAKEDSKGVTAAASASATVNMVNGSGTTKMKFGVLIGLIEVGEISNRDVVDTVLNLLVGGEFDLESNYVIAEPENVTHLLELIDHCDEKLQAEIWSMFVAILRKSLLNLQACTEVSLITKLVNKLQSCNEMLSDLLMEILGVVASYSISVKELKLIFSFLKGDNGQWPQYSVKLLQVLKQIPRKHGPDVFFSFSGKNGAAIAMPPMARWPYQNGFTFTTWFRLDPVNPSIEKDKPYLYCFRTSKGIGYSGHFMGSCLVITAVKIKGKGFQHCIKHDFQPRKWNMVTVVHVYNRWRTSEIRCYVNGELVSAGEMQWHVAASDPFDKCFLGSAPTADRERTFCGQMSSVYLFSEALSAHQVHAMYLLGPNYRSHFKFHSESDVSLSEHYKKILYDGKMTNSIVFLYSPAATESQLCLDSSPKGNVSYFVHSPHALMVQDVRAIVTHSIHSTLHSIGGIHMIFPLFTQLDYIQPATEEGQEDQINPDVCPLLLHLLCDLLKGSMSTQQQMVQGRGFVILGYLLQKASMKHMTETALELFLDLAKYYNTVPAGIQLLRHLVDHILFNPVLWIHTPVKTQISLYTFLSNEFVGQSTIYTNIRRVSTVLQLMHTLKYYYWIVNPEDRSGIVPKGLDGPRPSTEDLLSLRALILRITKQLILKEKSANDEELQIILNYLMTIHEDVNLKDVLQLLLSLMAENSNGMAVAFDRKNGVRVIYKLLASSDEIVRAMAVKVLALFLSRLPHKRKMDLMYAHNLYSLLGERLLLTSNSLSMVMYNCLFELLTEHVSLQVATGSHIKPDKTYKVTNPGIFHVTARLLRQSAPSEATMEVKKLFLSDMILLFNHSRENRRILLQCSVWQDWMINLAYIFPKTEEEKKVTEMVYSLLRMLLHHAMKYEWGGWRVWVDTLSIIHSKVSFEEHKQELLKAYNQYQNSQGANGSGAPASISAAINKAQLESMYPEDSVSPLAAMTGGYGEQAGEGHVAGGAEDKEESKPATEPEPEAAEDKYIVKEVVEDLISDVIKIVDGKSALEGQEGERDEADGSEETSLDAAATPSEEKSPEEESNKDISDQSAVSIASSDSTATSSTASHPTPLAASQLPGAQGGVAPAAAAVVGAAPHPSTGHQWLPAAKQRHPDEDQTSLSRQGSRFFSPGPHQAPYRIPEFSWSGMHQRMMSDLLFAIETDIQVWRSNNTRTVIDYVNAAENTIFVQNVTQMVSQIMDNLIYSAGGILPMLSSATSRSHEPDVIEPTQGLPLDVGISFINRIMNLVDVLVFASNQNFGELEVEKNMPRGGILRQCLRLTTFCAIRNVLECRFRTQPSPSSSHISLSTLSAAEPTSPTGRLQTLINATQPSTRPIGLKVTAGARKRNIVENLAGPTSPIKDLGRLLQDMDVHRLRAVVYRDVEESKQAQFLALAIVYFISVLMVARYRDILDNEVGSSTPSSARSRQNSLRQKPSHASSSQSLASETPLENRGTQTVLTRLGKKAVARERPVTKEMAPSKPQAQIVMKKEAKNVEESGPADTTVKKMENDVSETINTPQMDTKPTPVVKPGSPPQRESDAVPEKIEEAQTMDEQTAPKDSPEMDNRVVEGEEQKDVKEAEEGGELHKEKRIIQEEIAEDASIASKEPAQEKVEVEKELAEDEKSENNAKEKASEEEMPSKEKGGDTDEETDTRAAQRESPDGQGRGEGDAPPTFQAVAQLNARVVANGSAPSASAQSSPDEAGAAGATDGPLNTASISSMITASEKVEKRPLQTWPWTATADAETQENEQNGGQPKQSEDPEEPYPAMPFPMDHSVPPAGRSDAPSNSARPKNLELDSMTTQSINSFSDCYLGEGTVEERLTKALETAAPLLREIFIDFAPFLSKTLLGSHGQELLIEGLVSMKSSNSVIELVMMLCSQEWQNSIQKHAGLAFIELVNEGRIYSHATRDHLLRVANEAEFILSRHRAEDVQKHAEFESMCAQSAMECKEEEKMCDHLITAARRRDHIFANQLLQKTINILTNKHGAWGNVTNKPREFYRVDMWEDNTRRHRRLIRNPLGSTHPEATLMAAIEHGEDEDVIEKAKEALHAQLAAGRRFDAQAGEFEEDSSSLQDDKDVELETELEGPVVYSTAASLIAPCVVAKGSLSITSSEMYFEVDEDDPAYKELDPKVLAYTEGLHGRWHFNDIRAVFSRRYLLQNTAVEIFLANRTSVMFNLPNKATVKKVVHALPRVGVGLKYGIPPSRRVSLATPRQLFKASNMTQAWQRREITNFEYLMYLNTIAGRSYNDLNQYPIFPWVLTNYDAEELDLTLPSNYRDLSKPVGALNPSRRAFFQERYENWEDDKVPPFHFGTHYSTMAFTLNWLMRMEPYTTYFLNLQGGKFDHASRSFASVYISWKNCQRDTSDVKELIPEFYYLPEMFINSNDYTLGNMPDDGAEVGDVVLPRWAKTAEEFVRINRLALESEFVSCQIHQWIDLIFGYKQRGPEAVRATNVFYYLTYEGSINLETIEDPVMREAIENQIRSFGQTPAQLLTEPHPPRSSAMHLSPMMYSDQLSQDVLMIIKFLSNSPVIHVSAHTHPNVPIPAIVTAAANQTFAMNKWNNQVATAGQPGSPGYSMDAGKNLLIELDPLILSTTGMHRRQIVDTMDSNVKAKSSCYVVTADNRYLMACGFWDKSFRVFLTDTCKVTQVVYGHWDMVTCLVRSECPVGGDCYIVSGSRDATLLVWHWSAKVQWVLGENHVLGEMATPRAILTGHDTEVVCAAVCTELGLVISGSLGGACLIHTVAGDLLRSLDPPNPSMSPRLMSIASEEGVILVNFDKGHVCSYTINGKFLKSTEVTGTVNAIRFKHEGDYFLTGGDNRQVQVWRTFDHNLMYSFPLCDASILAIDMAHEQRLKNHQDRTIIAGMATGSIVAFNVNFSKWHHEFRDTY